MGSALGELVSKLTMMTPIYLKLFLYEVYLVIHKFIMF